VEERRTSMASRRLFGEGDTDLSGEGLGASGHRQVLEVVVPLRLTRAHKERLVEIAREMGLSLSAYLRQVVLGQPLPPRRAIRPIPEINQQSYIGLGHVAASLGQLVTLVQTGTYPARNELLEILALVAKTVDETRRAVIGIPASTSERNGE
jgi:hypothetical protein